MAERFSRAKDDVIIRIFEQAAYLQKELGYDITDDNLVIAEEIVHRIIDRKGVAQTWDITQAIVDHGITNE